MPSSNTNTPIHNDKCSKHVQDKRIAIGKPATKLRRLIVIVPEKPNSQTGECYGRKGCLDKICSLGKEVRQAINTIVQDYKVGRTARQDKLQGKSLNKCHLSKNGTKVLGERKRFLIFVLINSASLDFHGLINLKIWLVKIRRILFAIYSCPCVCFDQKLMIERSGKRKWSPVLRGENRGTWRTGTAALVLVSCYDLRAVSWWSISVQYLGSMLGRSKVGGKILPTLRGSTRRWQMDVSHINNFPTLSLSPPPSLSPSSVTLSLETMKKMSSGED